MFDLKDNKLLIGICLGSVTTLLVAVLAGVILFTTLKPEPVEPPAPIVTAEQVVDAGFGEFYLNEYKEREFRLYTQDQVVKDLKERKMEARKEGVKGTFKKIKDVVKAPFRWLAK
jgi:hypothetical protein